MWRIRSGGSIGRIGAALIAVLLLWHALPWNGLTPASAGASTALIDATAIEQAQMLEAAKPAKKKSTDEMSWVRLQKQFPGAFVTHGPRNRKRIALTFDDAPDPRFTPAILDILSQHKVCATFFVVGNRAAAHPDLIRRMVREGHVVGNHSYNHAVLPKLSEQAFRKQILKTDAIIKRITGYRPRFIRPPYGEVAASQVAWTRKNGFIVVNWDVDSVDWNNNPSSSKVLLNIKRTLQPGSIVLQHAGGGDGQSLTGTIEALPRLIVSLKKRGYELVTLPELLSQSKVKAQK
ncbi:polysaccharide deacetylase family protein [Paenibacillus sp. NPDC058071]|uniref:polysaccharide deacetylase family protein n=1 Tax=Paenibacillus sp. NPDC058071 TaxID=3346326 RepID=UPI0036DEA581